MNNYAKPVRIAALGMERRTYNTLQLFFRGQCKNSYVLVEEQSADISIIDMDGYQATSVFEGHKKHYPNRPAILISLSDTHNYDAVYVRKPIQLSALTSALGVAIEKLRETPSETMEKPLFIENEPNEHQGINASPPLLSDAILPEKKSAIRITKSKTQSHSTAQSSLESLSDDSDLEFMYLNQPSLENFNPGDPAQLSKALYQPQQLLQGYFQQACALAEEKQRDVLLEGPWRPITILHKTNELRVAHNYRHLFALSTMQFKPDEVAISLLTRGDTAMPTPQKLVLPIEPFLWKLTLRSCRGRVPVSTNLDLPVKLLKWPNFTRVTITPNAMRIAALWSKQPTSLLNTAAILSIPLYHVFLFYSAAVSLNLVTLASAAPSGENTSTSTVKRHSYRSIFQVLLNKLRNT